MDSPCPVSRDFCYNGEKKENLIIAIGRWNDEEQKRSRCLMETLEHFYSNGGDAAMEIYGTMTPALQEWREALPEAIRLHISLKGYVDNDRLKDVYNRARTIVCTSSHEGSHNVSAEALCCGCSVVVTNRPRNLSALHWYTSHQSGQISAIDTPASWAEALAREETAWENGERDPMAISSYWRSFFHADKVYSRIFSLE